MELVGPQGVESTVPGSGAVSATLYQRRHFPLQMRKAIALRERQLQGTLYPGCHQAAERFRQTMDEATVIPLQV